MVTIKGKRHPTISDAAKAFGVSVKTVQDWIGKGKIPRPPQEIYGSSMIQVFPTDYMDNANRQLGVYRQAKRKQGRGPRTR